MSKSSVTFTKGLYINMSADKYSRLSQWHIIGTVNDQPFYLQYFAFGATSWNSPADLDKTLRTRILGRFRTQVRAHDPQNLPWVTCYELDMLNTTDPVEIAKKEKVHLDVINFYNTEWRINILKDNLNDYLDLQVPYADRLQAKNAGAVWRGDKKIWQIHKDKDLTPVQAWLPVAAPLTSIPSPGTP